MVATLEKIIQNDDHVLEQRLGYKQKMDRGFSRISLLAMGFCVLKYVNNPPPTSQTTH